jgi:hypothetical protein
MASDVIDPHRFPTNSEVEKRLLADPQFKWDGQCGGTCPVIVEFMIDGLHGAFRARGTSWSFILAVEGVIDPANDDEEFFKIESYFEAWPGAGYMPAVKALEFIEASIAAFRAIRSITL